MIGFSNLYGESLISFKLVLNSRLIWMNFNKLDWRHLKLYILSKPAHPILNTNKT